MKRGTGPRAYNPRMCLAQVAQGSETQIREGHLAMQVKPAHSHTTHLGRFGEIAKCNCDGRRVDLACKADGGTMCPMSCAWRCKQGQHTMQQGCRCRTQNMLSDWATVVTMIWAPDPPRIVFRKGRLDSTKAVNN